MFPSVTRVCSSSIATGAPPAVHGIVGNAFFHPEGRRAPAARPRDARGFSPLRAGGRAGADRADLRGRAGHGRQAARDRAWRHAWRHLRPRAAAPRSRVTGSTRRTGRRRASRPMPSTPCGRASARSRRAACRCSRSSTASPTCWSITSSPTLAPDVALAWFPEPDTSAHYIGLGAPETLAVLRRCDAQFGRILDALEARGWRERTLVMALSDHGQITVTEEIPLFEDLTRAGFPTATAAEEGAVLQGVAGAFGELRLRTATSACGIASIAWLQEHPAIGHLFSRDVNGIDGRCARHAVAASGRARPCPRARHRVHPALRHRARSLRSAGTRPVHGRRAGGRRHAWRPQSARAVDRAGARRPRRAARRAHRGARRPDRRRADRAGRARPRHPADHAGPAARARRSARRPCRGARSWRRPAGTATARQVRAWRVAGATYLIRDDRLSPRAFQINIEIF